MRILTFTTLYPNAVVPHHGIFVEHRLRHLLQNSSISSTVFAPVPWFPFRSPRFGDYAAYASIPESESRNGVDVFHPRYPLIPKIGMGISPLLMAFALLRKLRKFRVSNQDFDIIDAHYFYPDGVAAVLLGRWLRKPVVVTARGTDINLIPEYRIPRYWIDWAASRCAAIITVSDALRDRILELGVPADKVRTLRNGVDLELFSPEPNRDLLRQQLNMSGFTLLSVGHLIERKGHHIVIESLTELPDVNLIVVGDGAMRNELECAASRHDVANRVRFVAALPQDRLKEYYCAADALVLASSREGMANVLLESLACGTPVVATPYWGSPEVITNPAAGQLTGDRSYESIAGAVNALRGDYPDRGATRRHAEEFGWHPTTEGQIQLFRELAERAK